MKKVLYTVSILLLSLSVLLPYTAQGQAGTSDNPNLECRCAAGFICNNKEECVPENSGSVSTSNGRTNSNKASTTNNSTNSTTTSNTTTAQSTTNNSSGSGNSGTTSPGSGQSTPSGTTGSSTSSSTKNFGIDQASNINLPSQSLPVFVGTIIRWIMGMLGVVLVAMFVYGGVTYATAAGNEERASSAKRILTYAIIGSVIVVASAIISEFVLNALLSQSTNTPTTTNTSSASGAESGSTSTTPSTGTSTSTSNNSGTRLPTTNQRGLAALCSPGGTSCSTGFACTKEPTGAQYYCLIPKGRECNTNTSSVVGDHGCEFNTTCVKKKNPTTPAGLPDFSQNDGVCE